MQGTGALKQGVWSHSYFNRARAVRCLKVALRTGDTNCFMTATAAKDEVSYLMNEFTDNSSDLLENAYIR